MDCPCYRSARPCVEFSPRATPHSVLLGSLSPFPYSEVSSHLPLPSRSEAGSIAFSFVLGLNSSVSFLFACSLFFFCFVPFRRSLDPVSLVLCGLARFLVGQGMQGGSG